MAPGTTCRSSCSADCWGSGSLSWHASLASPLSSEPSGEVSREAKPVNTRTGLATIVRGGLLLDVRAHRADLADILVTGDTITEIGAPGMPAPPDATVIDARGLLL